MDYLTKPQIEELIKVAKRNRYGLRDGLIILMSFRHGLRVSETITLEWNMINFSVGKLFLNRSKHGNEGHHYLQGDEMRLLRRLQRNNTSGSRFIFNSERGDPLSTRGVNHLVSRCGRKLGWKISPHILRHSCGYHLANQGHDTRLIQDYLGHKSISSTMIYTKTNPERYRQFKW